MKQKIHLIGNAHIDIFWLWKWEEGLQEILSSFASALDRIREHNNFIFTSACAYYYSLVEETDPKLFERIPVIKDELRILTLAGLVLRGTFPSRPMRSKPLRLPIGTVPFPKPACLNGDCNGGLKMFYGFLWRST